MHLLLWGILNFLSLSDHVSTDCYGICSIRNYKPNLPIIVIHSNYFEGHESGDALRKYSEAGTTDFFDWTASKNDEPFIDLLKKHLNL